MVHIFRNNSHEMVLRFLEGAASNEDIFVVSKLVENDRRRHLIVKQVTEKLAMKNQDEIETDIGNNG